ncbi:hypothetical protein DTO207G8_2938 [Paecilomyces variotii]|nr:hypothetical protein DTO207G8_2938 [Paecilomyces variotii]
MKSGSLIFMIVVDLWHSHRFRASADPALYASMFTANDLGRLQKHQAEMATHYLHRPDGMQQQGARTCVHRTKSGTDPARKSSRKKMALGVVAEMRQLVFSEAAIAHCMKRISSDNLR